MSCKFDIVVIGGGPAGIMAALTAKKENNNMKVCIVEANEMIGKKLRITGGGRCNFTNNKDISSFFDAVVNNKKFLYSSLYTFSNEDIKKYINSLGIDYIVEVDNEDKVYLKSGNSMDLIKAFEKEIRNNNIEILLNSKVIDLDLNQKIKKVYLKNKILESEKIIIATGGKSYPQTGSDGSVIELLKKKGYKIVEPVSALSPIKVKEKWLREMPGISLSNVELNIYNYDKKKKISFISGDIVFTHSGIGGPAALKASSYINRKIGEIYIKADFIPTMNKDELYSIAKSNSKKTVFNNLKGIFPNNFLKIVLEKAGTLGDGKFNFINDKSSNMSKNDFEIIVELLKNCKLTPSSLCEISKATITSGGISVVEIDSSTMESKKHRGVYFAGELIDVDALTGGYNLQIAFSTGYLAGLNVSEFF